MELKWIKQYDNNIYSIITIIDRIIGWHVQEKHGDEEPDYDGRQAQ